MKKVGIISRHAVANYGSLLQAYSLEKIFSQLGYKATTINYINKNEIGVNLAYSIGKLFHKNDNVLKKALFYMYQIPSCAHTYKKFLKYRKDLLNQTKLYKDYNELKNDFNDYDILCTGSDQVWNTISDGKLDETYFLNFSNNKQRKISYASSFGGLEILENNEEFLKDKLKKYNQITVREKDAVDLLRKIEIEGRQVLDPTLLLDKKYWEKFSNNFEIKEKYILVYQLKKNKEFDKYVNELKKITNYKVIRISTFFFQIFKKGKMKYLIPPKDVINYFINSELIITDSFHATAFAINLNKQFIEILPGRYNSRNLSLLELTGLKDRVLKDYNNFDMPFNEIDYTKVNNILKVERNNSINILKEICNWSDK